MARYLTSKRRHGSKGCSVVHCLGSFILWRFILIQNPISFFGTSSLSGCCGVRSLFVFFLKRLACLNPGCSFLFSFRYWRTAFARRFCRQAVRTSFMEDRRCFSKAQTLTTCLLLVLLLAAGTQIPSHTAVSKIELNESWSANNNTEFDFSEVARSGSNHVRYGMSFSWWTNYRNEQPFKNEDLSKLELGSDFWNRLDRDIALARKYNLWVILNLFTTPANCYEGYSATCSLWNNAWEKSQLKASSDPSHTCW